MVAQQPPSVEELHELFDNVNDIIYSHDLEGSFLAINQTGLKLFGLGPEDLPGLHVSDVVDPGALPQALAKIREKARGLADRSGPYQVLCRTRAGSPLWLEISSRIVGERKIFGVARDITARRRREEQLRELSMSDALTELYNGHFFREVLDKQVHNAERYAHDLALITLDLDDFRLVNEQHGHLAGDEVLRTVGQLLQTTVRTADFACRCGGEEFTVVLPDTTQSRAARLAERLREALAARIIEARGQHLSVTASFGVAEYCLGEGRDSFVERADRALYEAKARGKNTTVVSVDRTMPADVVL